MVQHVVPVIEYAQGNDTEMLDQQLVIYHVYDAVLMSG